MSDQLQILILEDRATDAELIMRELRRKGIQFNAKRVWTEADFLAELRNPVLDLILADYALPSFDGLSALELARKMRPGVPFILISGTLGEERAVDSVLRGATDYVLKQNLDRLVPAVLRALAEAEEHQKRLEAEKALRESEEMLRLLMDSTAEAIYGLDMDGKFTFCNAACLRLLGYAHARDLIGKNMHDLIHHSRADGTPLLKDDSRVRRSSRQGNGSHASDQVYWRADGTCFSVEYWSHPIWRGGRPIGTVVTFFDITERKREAEEASRMVTVVRDSNDAITIQDVAGKITAWNYGAKLMFGYSEQEALKMEIWQLAPPNKAAEQKDFTRRLFAGEKVTSFETQRVTKDGRVLDVWLTVTKLMDDAGKVIGIAATERDITERKRAEESHIRLVTAVEQAAETIVITDANATILYANPAFEKTSGYTREEAMGQNPRILKSGKQDAEFYRRMWAVLTRGEVWSGHFINKRKDGTLYHEEASISPVLDAAGKIINYVAVRRDVTREVAMEAQLRQAQKMEAIGTLAGGVAHEINNPINGIMNYAQVITDQLPADSPLQQFSANIMKETNRVSQIVRNLLSFARQNPQERSPANLNDIVKSVLTLVQSVIRHDQITLTVEVPEGLPQMECRSQQIEQVLLNLLTNARDALNEKYPAYHEDKIICITARLFEQDGKRWIRTTVEDHANGIPPGARDRVLDPFFTTKPAGKGTGLGLSISHGIVKDHHGELHFETETGRGTRFHMDLPLK